MLYQRLYKNGTEPRALHEVFTMGLSGLSKSFPQVIKVSIPQQSIFWSKYNIYPPPLSKNNCFPPSHDMSSFKSYLGLFAFIFPYCIFILPFYFFILHFPPVSLPLFIFFPQMTSADIPPVGGRGIF